MPANSLGWIAERLALRFFATMEPHLTAILGNLGVYHDSAARVGRGW